MIYEFQLDTTADFQAPQSAEVPRNAGGETSVMFDIGLEEVGDGIWNIVYYTTLLGKIDDRTARITGIRPAHKV